MVLTKKMPKPKRWWLFGLLAVSIGLGWSWLFFIDVAKLSSNAFVGYLTITFVFVAIVGLSALIFSQAIRYLRWRTRVELPWIALLRIAAVWAFAELAVSWLVAVIWMGHNGSWSTVLPFSSLTPLIMWTPFKFLARFVGYYGLSGVAVAVLWGLSVKRLRSAAWWGLAVLIVFTAGAWRLYAHPNGQAVKTYLVAEHLGQPRPLNASSQSLVVLPEYGLDETTTSTVSRRIRGNNVAFVGSRQQPRGDGVGNFLIFGSTADGFRREEPKTRLIPGGEYLAYPVAGLLKAFDSATYTNFQLRRAVIKGNQAIQPFTVNQTLVLGSGACSSIIANNDYRRLSHSGATLLTNSASLDIFQGSRLFSWQQKSFAKFMAVANARSFVQSANDGQAYALNLNGNQVAAVSPFGTTSVDLATNHQRTPYTLAGEWLAVGGAVFVVVDIAKAVAAKRRRAIQ